MRRNWRKDNMRLEGPYGVPAQYLTSAEKAQIDARFLHPFAPHMYDNGHGLVVSTRCRVCPAPADGAVHQVKSR